MYKIATDLSQRRARQLWLRDLLPTDFDELPPEQQRENLVAQLKRLEGEILAISDSTRRKALGKRKLELQGEIHALRPKLRGPQGVQGFFVEVARERLSPFLFRTFLDEASKRAKEQSAP